MSHSASNPAAPLVVPPHCVAILDAGAQYSKVIDRRVRELQVESHILPLHTPVESLAPYAAVIISGGPQSVYGAEAPKYDANLFTQFGKPILGICYGMQLMNHACGGGIAAGGVREDGQFLIDLKQVEPDGEKSKLYASLPDQIEVLLTHGDSVTSLAPGFRLTSTSPAGIVASLEDPVRRMYGVQYHPEVDLTPQGSLILQNFLDGVCALPRTFTLQSRQHAAIDEIRGIVGDKSKVLCLLSGGVDSSVCAALLKEAIGADRVSNARSDLVLRAVGARSQPRRPFDSFSLFSLVALLFLPSSMHSPQIIAIHIDNGFMRYEESKRVVEALEHIGLKIHLVDGTHSKGNMQRACTTLQ